MTSTHNKRGKTTVPKLDKTVVLVGLMGAGKSAVGRRLAARLGLPFIDADAEIEAAADASINDIFERHGEAAFRDGERRVIARLLAGPPHVLATGGGAFMDPSTRARIAERGVSVWLRADLETLVARTSRRDERPLLKSGEPRTILKELIEQRYPVYAEADIVVESTREALGATVGRVLAALQAHLADCGRPAPREAAR